MRSFKLLVYKEEKGSLEEVIAESSYMYITHQSRRSRSVPYLLKCTTTVGYNVQHSATLCIVALSNMCLLFCFPDIDGHQPESSIHDCY